MVEQLEFFSIPSPCVGICQVNDGGYCRGCMRSREERFNWQTMNATEQRNTLRLCRQRYIRMIRAQKVQQAKLEETEENPQQGLF
ncbi:DUF1289 domain-containing protein [Photobacterium swingsii]|uniref:DUF1289 domain-containing protein n=1 Tax=Photobacterium swingsii TaxID=680026 RepID=UPI0040680771